MNPPPSIDRPHPIGLTYASWHAHLAARTRTTLLFLPRRSAAHTDRSSRGAERIAHLSTAEWLAHLSGSGQRAA